MRRQPAFRAAAIAILSAALAGASLGGCTGNSASPILGITGDDSFKVIKVKAYEVKPFQLSPQIAVNSDEAAFIATGANDFAFRLSAQLAKENGDHNLVVSPFSVYLPLAALLNATTKEHQQELFTALGAGLERSGYCTPAWADCALIPVSDMNEVAARMLYNLTDARNKADKEYYNNPLKIANAIFVDKKQTLKPEFAQAFADYYQGTAINVDFTSPDAVRRVNNWASDNTDGLIPSLVQQFDPNTVAAIANAIYFSDRWSWEFKPEETKKGEFHNPKGTSIAHFMVHEGNMDYYEDSRLQAIPLRFKSGGGMYILLPKHGIANELLSDLTANYFNVIDRDKELSNGILKLPRFEFASDFDGLAETLTELGVPLFDAETAPLTGGLITSSQKVWLNKAIQKAIIKVDEKGTTAAAVTVMMAAGGAAPPQPTTTFEMICDKPFVFVLYGDTIDGGNQVLFTGIVNQPE